MIDVLPLSLRLHADGIARHEAEMARTVAAARHFGVSAALCDAALDRREAEVVRLRAWSRIAAALRFAR